MWKVHPKNWQCDKVAAGASAEFVEGKFVFINWICVIAIAMCIQNRASNYCSFCGIGFAMWHQIWAWSHLGKLQLSSQCGCLATWNIVGLEWWTQYENVVNAFFLASSLGPPPCVGMCCTGHTLCSVKCHTLQMPSFLALTGGAVW